MGQSDIEIELITDSGEIVFSKEIVREVEARMNREHTPPQLPALPATASLTHRHSRVSQVCLLPTVKEANRPVRDTLKEPGLHLNRERYSPVRRTSECSNIIDQCESATIKNIQMEYSILKKQSDNAELNRQEELQKMHTLHIQTLQNPVSPAHRSSGNANVSLIGKNLQDLQLHHSCVFNNNNSQMAVCDSFTSGNCDDANSGPLDLSKHSIKHDPIPSIVPHLGSPDSSCGFNSKFTLDPNPKFSSVNGFSLPYYNTRPERRSNCDDMEVEDNN